MSLLMNAVWIGVGATLVLDGWTIIRGHLPGQTLPNYGLVGRWLAWMLRGQFFHERIAASPALEGERLIGWTAHYLIGIAFAAILLVTAGEDWARNPALGPAMAVGIGSVAAPFFLMQPGMGAGIAASRTARPNAARLQSVISHAVFGFGLYVSALATRWLWPAT